MQDLSLTCRLRVAVAHLGEKPQSGWWDTAFLNPIGLKYLQLVFPKTTASACVTSASEAACRAHDERIGKGRVVHLFRLPEDMEIRVCSELASLPLPELEAMCSKDAAFRILAEIAGDAKASTGTGPAHIGKIERSSLASFHSRVAASYASAFRSGARIFPYFA